MNHGRYGRGRIRAARAPAPGRLRPATRFWLLQVAVVLIALPAMFVHPNPVQGAAGAPSGASRVIVLHIDDIVEPVLAEYISSGFDEAERSGAQLILITMNTPGGLDSSMREIIQRIIRSPIPVVTYVSPAGSRSASAGFFILLSADVAAMAPGTDTGAASPLLISILSGAPAQIDETLRKKIINEATAYLRSITGKRGRNTELAEKAVTEAKAFSEKEALEGRLIDLVSPSTQDLLAKLNGRKLTRFDGSSVTLELGNPVRTALEMTRRQRMLSYVARPDVMFILLIIGILGLYTEFTHPGMVAPGVIGGIALLLALYAMHILPVNYAGVALVFLAVVLFILEAKFSSHGVLAVGGVVAMLLGAVMLIRSPLTGAGVSLGVALGATLPFAALTVFLMRLVLRSRGWKPATGAEQLIGAIGEVTAAIEPTQGNGSGRGMVRVHGELWRAVSREMIPIGARVRVVQVEGLTLHVEPASGEPKPGA